MPKSPAAELEFDFILRVLGMELKRLKQAKHMSIIKLCSQVMNYDVPVVGAKLIKEGIHGNLK